MRGSVRPQKDMQSSPLAELLRVADHLLGASWLSRNRLLQRSLAAAGAIVGAAAAWAALGTSIADEERVEDRLRVMSRDDFHERQRRLARRRQILWRVALLSSLTSGYFLGRLSLRARFL